MSHILVVTTGGTIAMRPGAQSVGAVPQLGGQDFQLLLPKGETEVAFEAFCNLPSAHFTTAIVSDLARFVADRAQHSDVAGIVITHGTDVLEETAYLLDLVIDAPKPIVVTGAMRTANAVGYDGIANIASAVQVARSDVARNQGVMVVFNEQIFAAATVQKVHSQSVDAFAAPSAGPIGSMLRGTPVFFCQTRRPPPFPFKGLIEPVDLLTASVAADDGLLRASIERGARGLVLEAFGSGRVPPWWLPTMRDARARGIPIVITTRTGAGNLGDDYGFEGSSHSLREMGCLFASNLNGAKARIKLMAALAGSSPNGVAKYFQT